MTEGCYRLNSPTMAVQAGGTNGRMSIFTVPTGAVIEVLGAIQQSGLVDVRFQGRVVAMFLQDIQTRGVRLRSAAAV